jgi:hypothetical protein
VEGQSSRGECGHVVVGNPDCMANLHSLATPSHFGQTDCQNFARTRTFDGIVARHGCRHGDLETRDDDTATFCLDRRQTPAVCSSLYTFLVGSANQEAWVVKCEVEHRMFLPKSWMPCKVPVLPWALKIRLFQEMRTSAHGRAMP